MNPATKCDDWLFQADACAITLAHGDESIACNADIRTGLDGRTLVSIHRQDETAASLRVRSAFGARGKRTATPLSLRGTTLLGFPLCQHR